MWLVWLSRWMSLHGGPLPGRVYNVPRLRSNSSESTDIAEQSTEVETDSSQLGSPETGSLVGDELAGPASSSKSSSAPVDLSGNWLLSRVEGDFEALMADAGVSWALRKLAKSMNYGAGLVSQTVEQEGSSLVITFNNGPGQPTNVMRLNVGSGLQIANNEDGSCITVDPRWEDQCLYMSGKSAGGTDMQPTKRYLSGQEMVCESTTSTGIVVRRFFSRI